MILRICIVIPTYNNPQSIAKVVADTLLETSHPIYVFDDGSEQPVETLIAPHPRVKIFRTDKNLGKGAALRRAIQILIPAGFTHMLTLDGDGQHLPSQCNKLIEEIKKHPWDFIIGKRRFETAGDVPKSSRFGRWFSNFWIRYETDFNISDSQSGMRVYPLFHLQMMKFWSKRFDFEVETLVRLVWKGVQAREVEIEVYYPPQNERVSHFNKWVDNVFIVSLNIFFVFVSLLRGRISPKLGALAVGTGVFIGCTPFIGFHVAIIALFSLVFRLNAVYMLLGSQISIPPLMPFLLLASNWLGQHIFHVKNPFLACLSGSVILGLGLGSVIGILVYLAILRFRTSKKGGWVGHTRGGRMGPAFLIFVMRTIGLRAVYAFMIGVVPYFYLTAPLTRRGVDEFWRVFDPSMSWWRRQIKCIKQIWIFAQILIDRVYISKVDKNYFATRPTGWENILKLRKANSGAILLSGHIGGWDLASSILDQASASFDERRVFIVRYLAKGLDFEEFKEDASSDERRLAINVEQQPIMRIRELLQKGNFVGLMTDRPLGSRLELVPMFGKLAVFDSTIFHLSALCGAPFIPTFGFKAEKNIYDFYAFEPTHATYNKTTARELQCYRWLSEYVGTVETLIKQYPSQWFNFFNFWSFAPEQAPTTKTDQNYLIEELQTQRVPEVEMSSSS